MKEIKLIIASLLLLSVVVIAQQVGTPNNIRVITDANNSLLVANEAQVNPLSQPTTFINARVRTDASGNLVVTGASDINAVWGNITGTLSNQTDLQNALNAKQDVLNGIDAGPFTVVESLQVTDGLVTTFEESNSLASVITTTGNISALALGRNLTIFMNNASLSTIQGITAPVLNGIFITILSIGAGQVDIANESGSASAANRIINGVTGTISLSPGSGKVELVYDGVNSRWRVVNHEQGNWITPTFAAGDYTGNGAMTWTVASGDVVTFKYYLRGRQLSIIYFFNGTTVGGTLGTSLQREMPGGFITSGTYRGTSNVINNGVDGVVGLCSGVDASNLILFQLNTIGTNWTASTDNTGIHGEVVISVQ